jgi:hypothetical protein
MRANVGVVVGFCSSRNVTGHAELTTRQVNHGFRRFNPREEWLRPKHGESINRCAKPPLSINVIRDPGNNITPSTI